MHHTNVTDLGGEQEVRDEVPADFTVVANLKQDGFEVRLVWG